jgi:hypothetical protein
MKRKNIGLKVITVEQLEAAMDDSNSIVTGVSIDGKGRITQIRKLKIAASQSHVLVHKDKPLNPIEAAWDNLPAVVFRRVS